MLKQDKLNSPPSNSIIGKKSDEKAHKNSKNNLPVIDRGCQVLSTTLVISNFWKERKKIGILGKIVKTLGFLGIGKIIRDL